VPDAIPALPAAAQAVLSQLAGGPRRGFVIAQDLRMIVVVEGISAVGKSTWCRRHAPDQAVPETGPVAAAPDRRAAPLQAADFWASHNARRWAAARAMESATGLAVCDTDPFKLHYVWSLWQIGEASEAGWQAERDASRALFAEQRLGFADRYYVKTLDPVIARRQRDGDPGRARRQFDLHVRLQDPLVAWYRAIAAVLPASVVFAFPETEWKHTLTRHPDAVRYSVDRFDQAMALLPCRA